MISIAQYDSLFSLYVCLLATLPCVVLGCLGRKSKILNLGISILVLVSIVGIHTIQFLELLAFFVGEIVLIYFYLAFRKRSTSELIYYLVFFLSLLPILLVRSAPFFSGHANLFGFVGLSYMCFKVWQILMEVHDGKIENISMIDLLGCLLFFPSFSSGPIARFQEFQQESELPFSRTAYLTKYVIPGFRRIFTGLFYKMAVAFFIHFYVMSRISDVFSWTNMILYMYTYTFYLFFDFVGYTSIAIGFGYLLGIRLPENFNRPFLARNMKEFWARWHMSLSRWFNDYVFSRFVLNTVRNGFFKNTKAAARWGYLFSMTLMGLWHGFTWHYITYGMYEGILLVLTDIYVRSSLHRRAKKKIYFDRLSRLVCFQCVAFGMLLFSGKYFPF